MFPTGFELLLLYVGFALGVSFLCSLLEAGLLSVRESQLAACDARGAKLLLDIKQNRIDDAISAILTLNTIAHTIGATLAGAQAALVFGDVWVGVFSGVLTLLVLLVTEIIPKTIGATYAAQLVGFVGRVTSALMVALTPVLWVTRGITQLLTPAHRVPVSPVEIAALVAMATRQGTVRREHKRLFDNVLALDEVQVRDVMTPHTVAAMLPASMSLKEFMEARKERIFSRIPVFDKSRDDVVGYVVQRQVLDAIASGADRSEPLRTYARDAWFVPELANINVAMRQFMARREHLAVVVDEFAAVVGVATLEDLIETILGVEIVDETDHTTDMRALAMKLRDERLAKLDVSIGT